VVDAVAPVGELLSPQVVHDLPLTLPIDAIDEVAEEQVFARDGAVGLELSEPVPIRRLTGEQVGRRALDGRVDVGRYRCSRSHNCSRHTSIAAKRSGRCGSAFRSRIVLLKKRAYP